MKDFSAYVCVLILALALSVAGTVVGLHGYFDRGWLNPTWVAADDLAPAPLPDDAEEGPAILVTNMTVDGLIPADPTVRWALPVEYRSTPGTWEKLTTGEWRFQVQPVTFTVSPSADVNVFSRRHPAWVARQDVE